MAYGVFIDQRRKRANACNKSQDLGSFLKVVLISVIFALIAIILYNIKKVQGLKICNLNLALLSSLPF